MTTRKSSKTTKTTTIPTSSVRLPKGAARPTTCGAYRVTFGDITVVTAKGRSYTAAEGCKHLPLHNGDHSTAKPVGLLTKAQRVTRKAAMVTKSPKKPVGKVVTYGGTKYLKSVGADGSIVLTPVAPKEPVVVNLPEAGPEGRDIQPQRTARRAKAAPKAGRRDRSVGEAVAVSA